MGAQKYSTLDIKLSYDTNKVTYKSNSAVIKCSGTYSGAKIDDSIPGYVTLKIPSGTGDYISTGGEMFTATFTVNSIDNNGIKFSTATGVEKSGGASVLAPENSSVTITCAHGTTEVKETSPTCYALGTRKTVCTSCSHVVSSEDFGTKLPHTEIERVTKTATCTESGKKKISCSECHKDLRTEEIPATGHDYGAWTVVKAATVDTEGSEERICSVCGSAENRTIAKLDKPNDGNVTQPTEQQTTENTTQSTEQQTTEKTTQSTEQQTTENTTQSIEQQTTESTANGVNTGDATPIVLLSIICTLAFAGILLVAGRKNSNKMG
jgi:hypothetical protein